MSNINEIIANFLIKINGLIYKKTYIEPKIIEIHKISHTVCINGNKFTDKCDICESTNGRCLITKNNDE